MPPWPHVTAARGSLAGTTILGGIQLRALIGEGATGSVYRAYDPSMDRDVAVKVLHPELARDPIMVERMAREARAVARLSHPSIVSILGAGELPADAHDSTPRPYLVMQWVDGTSVADVIDGGEPISAARAIAWAQQIAAALADTHAAGVVHRDLKPENLMLVRPRNPRADERIVILDFGVAKMVGGPLVSGSKELTQAGAICGTPCYLSPEQAAGDDVDHRADIYSLGVLLYELVTGRPPFDGTAVSVLVSHLEERPRPPAEIAVVDPRLSAVIMRCLEKDPARRYPDAEALSRALAAVAEPHASSADADAFAATVALPRPSASLDAWAPPLPARRRPLRYLAAAALLAAGVAVGIGVRDSALETSARAGAPAAAARAASARAAASRPGATATHTLPPPDIISSSQPAPGRTLIVDQGGYSLRVELPERVVATLPTSFELEVWDTDGRPITAAELILTIDTADGQSTGVAARPDGEPGRYHFERTFTAPGTHELRVYPPEGGTSIRLFFDVVQPGADAV